MEEAVENSRIVYMYYMCVVWDWQERSQHQLWGARSKIRSSQGQPAERCRYPRARGVLCCPGTPGSHCSTAAADFTDITRYMLQSTAALIPWTVTLRVGGGSFPQYCQIKKELRHYLFARSPKSAIGEFSTYVRCWMVLVGGGGLEIFSEKFLMAFTQ